MRERGVVNLKTHTDELSGRPKTEFEWDGIAEQGSPGEDGA